ncbi:hypothetical protein [Haliscomenobacter sp.]|uniref:hypothetical protein n=1 Tax=Haliscomenobacter sp. TaxID=2717303 RepID=UPI003BA90C59
MSHYFCIVLLQKCNSKDHGKTASKNCLFIRWNTDYQLFGVLQNLFQFISRVCWNKYSGAFSRSDHSFVVWIVDRAAHFDLEAKNGATPKTWALFLPFGVTDCAWFWIGYEPRAVKT